MPRRLVVFQGLKNPFCLGLFGSMEEESMDTEGQLHPQNLPTFHLLITILVSEPPSLSPWPSLMFFSSHLSSRGVCSKHKVPGIIW